MSARDNLLKQIKLQQRTLKSKRTRAENVYGEDNYLSNYLSERDYLFEKPTSTATLNQLEKQLSNLKYTNMLRFASLNTMDEYIGKRTFYTTLFRELTTNQGRIVHELYYKIKTTHHIDDSIKYEVYAQLGDLVTKHVKKSTRQSRSGMSDSLLNKAIDIYTAITESDKYTDVGGFYRPKK